MSHHVNFNLDSLSFERNMSSDSYLTNRQVQAGKHTIEIITCPEGSYLFKQDDGEWGAGKVLSSKQKTQLLNASEDIFIDEANQMLGE